jgi:divinyl protochlorophyllide a 8-vinyl-reductase
VKAAASISEALGDGTYAGAVADPARIGPNAVIQLAAALRAAGQDALAAHVFTACGVPEWRDHPPGDMVDERRVARLHQAVRATVPDAPAILSDAGRRTADYLLANRIPKPAQALLKILPARPAAAILVAAIRRNAWTFAGSATFAAHTANPTVFEITRNPICAGEHAAAPVCDWHAAVFERLFQALVSRKARAVETLCEADGGACCRFEVGW